MFEKKKLFASLGVGTFFSEELLEMELVKLRIRTESSQDFGSEEEGIILEVFVILFSTNSKRNIILTANFVEVINNLCQPSVTIMIKWFFFDEG